MSTLQEIINKSPKKKSNSSVKNAAYYNREKSECIRTLSRHENVVVREAIASNEHTSASILNEMLKTEVEQSVLKAILLHPNLSVKSILSFIATDKRAKMFGEDDDICELTRAAVK